MCSSDLPIAPQVQRVAATGHNAPPFAEAPNVARSGIGAAREHAPQLGRGEIDLAVVNLPTDDPDVIEEPLFDEDRVVVAPEDHPLAAHETLTLPEVADHELLLAAVGTVFRAELDAAAAAAGVTLRPKAEVDGLRLVADRKSTRLNSSH